MEAHTVSSCVESKKVELNSTFYISAHSVHGVLLFILVLCFRVPLLNEGNANCKQYVLLFSEGVKEKIQ